MADHSDISDIYATLASERRRTVIRLLDEADSSLTLRDLAIEVTREERRGTGQSIEKEQLEAVRISLYHVHVPKLADAALVEYDDSENRVSLQDAAPPDPFETV